MHSRIFVLSRTKNYDDRYETFVEDLSYADYTRKLEGAEFEDSLTMLSPLFSYKDNKLYLNRKEVLKYFENKFQTIQNKMKELTFDNYIKPCHSDVYILQELLRDCYDIHIICYEGSWWFDYTLDDFLRFFDRNRNFYLVNIYDYHF